MRIHLKEYIDLLILKNNVWFLVNIIVQKIFQIDFQDNEQTLKRKTQKLEYKAYPEAIIKIFRYN